jgi:hypothetical protein
MPFKVFKDEMACSVATPYGVWTVNEKGERTGTRHGCHATEEEAMKQMRAMYANVPEARR